MRYVPTPVDGDSFMLADIACRDDIEAAVAAACEACRHEENCSIET